MKFQAGWFGPENLIIFSSRFRLSQDNKNSSSSSRTNQHSCYVNIFDTSMKCESLCSTKYFAVEYNRYTRIQFFFTHRNIELVLGENQILKIQYAASNFKYYYYTNAMIPKIWIVILDAVPNAMYPLAFMTFYFDIIGDIPSYGNGIVCACVYYCWIVLRARERERAYCEIGMWLFERSFAIKCYMFVRFWLGQSLLSIVVKVKYVR